MYLAVILIGGGSSWARMESKENAIKTVCKILKQDWGKYYKLNKGSDVSVTVVDVDGYDDIYWDYDGFFYKNEDGSRGKIDRSRIEYVKSIL